jgi:hypothetical protein
MRLIGLALTAAAALVATTVAESQQLRVTRNVNLRESPSTELPPIRTLLPGTVLRVLDLTTTDGYYNALTADGEEGWVWSRNVVVEEMPPEIPPYVRAEWRHWWDEDGDCQNARTEVLIRQALEITLRTRPDGRECAVESGRWVDPFSGDTLDAPGGLDIDHVVPLQNAHLSGGWAWDADRRRAFANDMIDPLHLLAVTARLNRQKGARGPDTWLPPDTAFSCAYVAAWESIKQRWQLVISAPEQQAIDSVRQVRTC